MGKIRVLVVDDSFFVRKAVTRMLSKEPRIEVIETAADGKEAIEKIIRYKPDVVTMDIVMSGMDGITALGYIMNNMPLPVIMFSSHTQEGADLTLKALDMGALDFVDKSSTDASLL